MYCKKCGGRTKVNNSKNIADPNAKHLIASKYFDLGEDLTLRQHKCKQCDHTFHTIEIHADSFERKLNEIDEKLRENIEILTAFD